MNNLFNIPGLIFRNGKAFLNSHQLDSIEYQLYPTHRMLALHFVTPEKAQDIKDLIISYEMKNTYDYILSDGRDEKRYESNIWDDSDASLRIRFVLDVPKHKFFEMLNLTGCLA